MFNSSPSFQKYGPFEKLYGQIRPYFLSFKCGPRAFEKIMTSQGVFRKCFPRLYLELVRIICCDCRYIENSGCVGMCVNMCKLPTQDFFTNEFGLPLTMNPSICLLLFLNNMHIKFCQYCSIMICLH